MTLQPASASPQPPNNPEQNPQRGNGQPDGTAGAPSSSPSRAPSRLPRARRWSKSARALLAVAVLLVVGGAATAGWWFFGRSTGPRADLLLHKVRYEKLQLTIVERGTLNAAENHDIVCKLKARSQGSTVASSIRWVIDDGMAVEEGDKLIELDDSALQDQQKSQRIVVDQRWADYIVAEEDYKSTLIGNEADIAQAKVDLDVAEIDLEQYVNAVYVQNKKDIEGRLALAQGDLEMWRERAGWSKRMAEPGRKYVTVAQADSDQARAASAQVVVEKILEEQRVLEDPKFGQKVQMILQKKGTIEVKKKNLVKVQGQAISKAIQADRKRKTAQSTYEQELSRYQDIEEEIRQCVMYAPKAGLVVYYVPEQARFGTGQQQSIVAQGESVREGQKLMRIPDLSHMVVTTKIHEAMVSRIHGDRYVPTGFNKAVQAGLAATLDPFALVTAQMTFDKLRRDFVESHKDQEMALVGHGQRALIRSEAFPDRVLKGHVKTVATIASKQDWLSSDVQVYQAIVSIDESLEGLKPDMSAEVTIYTDAHADHVLAIPLQAVVGTFDMGRHRKCFVLTPHGPEQREITLGLSNETMVEVKEGLKEGDEVVLNPRVLLSDKDKNQAFDVGNGGGRGKRGRPGGGEGKGGEGKGGQKGGPGGFPKGGPGGPDGYPGGGPGGPNGFPKGGPNGFPKGGPGGPGGFAPPGGGGGGQ